MKASSSDSVKVFIRVRPFNLKESTSTSCVNFDKVNIEMNDKEPDHRFSFDQVFGMNSTQQQIYEKVGANVVDSAFEGFNGTVFAYGQTSSGKTHTCIGPDCMDPQVQGLLPRMVHQIFNKIQEVPTFIEFRIKISMVEIYMEKIKDLFDITKNDIKIREKQGKGIYLQEVTEQYVASAAETIELIKKGINHRSVGQTNMNDTSSRSHMAFIITLYQNNLKDASAKSGKIILVDLAGSEKISKTGAEGKLLDEAKQINKSLSALGNVINALTESKISHIPYRDSKLTRLLQESLGGNSKTNLIINVSPSSLNDHQTLSSLRFGYRAKQIKNKPKVNRQYTVAELLVLLQKSQKRIQELEQIIKEMTVPKKKNMQKKSTVQYIENLLDSDNPLITVAEDSADQKPKISSSPVKSKILKKSFDSECPSQSEDEVNGSPQRISELNKSLSQEKELLAEEIQFLNIEKVELLRELDIVQEKYEEIMRSNKLSSHKLNSIQRQNEKLLEKYVRESAKNQELDFKIQELQEKIVNYEEKILSIGAIPEKNSKVFGQSELSAKTKEIVNFVKQNKVQDQSMRIEDKLKEQKESHRLKDEKIEILSKKCKVLEEEIALFKHLEISKEAFIKEKLQFSKQKQRIYNDLQNRIQKVCELEEKLDDQEEKTKYYENLIKAEDSEKNRKILALQRHLHQVSENYYVLKGQQSSWLRDNKKTENKIETKNKQIMKLENEIANLKESNEYLKIQVADLEEDKESESILFDLNYTDDENTQNKGKIVKVVRSSTYQLSDSYE